MQLAPLPRLQVISVSEISAHGVVASSATEVESPLTVGRSVEFDFVRQFRPWLRFWLDTRIGPLGDREEYLRARNEKGRREREFPGGLLSGIVLLGSLTWRSVGSKLANLPRCGVAGLRLDHHRSFIRR